jgi:hypothetical protein
VACAVHRHGVVDLGRSLQESNRSTTAWGFTDGSVGSGAGLKRGMTDQAEAAARNAAGSGAQDHMSTGNQADASGGATSADRDVGAVLRSVYDEMVGEDVPAEMLALLGKLG